MFVAYEDQVKKFKKNTRLLLIKESFGIPDIITRERITYDSFLQLYSTSLQAHDNQGFALTDTGAGSGNAGSGAGAGSGNAGSGAGAGSGASGELSDTDTGASSGAGASGAGAGSGASGELSDTDTGASSGAGAGASSGADTGASSAGMSVTGNAGGGEFDGDLKMSEQVRMARRMLKTSTICLSDDIDYIDAFEEPEVEYYILRVLSPSVFLIRAECLFHEFKHDEILYIYENFCKEYSVLLTDSALHLIFDILFEKYEESQSIGKGSLEDSSICPRETVQGMRSSVSSIYSTIEVKESQLPTDVDEIKLLLNEILSEKTMNDRPITCCYRAIEILKTQTNCTTLVAPLADLFTQSRDMTLDGLILNFFNNYLENHCEWHHQVKISTINHKIYQLVCFPDNHSPFLKSEIDRYITQMSDRYIREVSNPMPIRENAYHLLYHPIECNIGVPKILWIEAGLCSLGTFDDIETLGYFQHFIINLVFDEQRIEFKNIVNDLIPRKELLFPLIEAYSKTVLFLCKSLGLNNDLNQQNPELFKFLLIFDDLVVFLLIQIHKVWKVTGATQTLDHKELETVVDTVFAAFHRIVQTKPGIPFKDLQKLKVLTDPVFARTAYLEFMRSHITMLPSSKELFAKIYTSTFNVVTNSYLHALEEEIVINIVDGLGRYLVIKYEEINACFRLGYFNTLDTPLTLPIELNLNDVIYLKDSETLSVVIGTRFGDIQGTFNNFIQKSVFCNAMWLVINPDRAEAKGFTVDTNIYERVEEISMLKLHLALLA